MDLSSARKSITWPRLGTLAASRGSGGSRPNETANGAMAHSLIARGSMVSQCSLRPWQLMAGIRGTWSVARPMRTAHQLAATAIANASGAVYSASSWDGYTRFPFTTDGSHSLGSWTWWQSKTGQSLISGRLCLKHWLLALAPMKQHEAYRLSHQRPVAIMACSCGRYQCNSSRGSPERRLLPVLLNSAPDLKGICRPHCQPAPLLGQMVWDRVAPLESPLTVTLEVLAYHHQRCEVSLSLGS